MQSASAESTAGLSASFTLFMREDCPPKNRAESVETLSFVLLFRGQSGVVRGEGDRISDRKLRASACYLAVRRHQETEEGRQRVVNTEESNY